jgi:hypothetical protein
MTGARSGGPLDLPPSEDDKRRIRAVLAYLNA